MRQIVLILPATAALLLPACNREEEPVANRFERQAAEIQNKARALEAQVENEVGGVEASLENEIDTLQNKMVNLGEAEEEAAENAAD